MERRTAGRRAKAPPHPFPHPVCASAYGNDSGRSAGRARPWLGREGSHAGPISWAFACMLRLGTSDDRPLPGRRRGGRHGVFIHGHVAQPSSDRSGPKTASHGSRAVETPADGPRTPSPSPKSIKRPVPDPSAPGAAAPGPETAAPRPRLVRRRRRLSSEAGDLVDVVPETRPHAGRLPRR
ncbi:hypothetical protein CDD83_2266 [Cordyceps sp. RAO-2017]|nr:hypothetical protein CDD83_2266 [Cordyceps sp. RAO-2017]